jgi:hypothetical protein
MHGLLVDGDEIVQLLPGVHLAEVALALQAPGVRPVVGAGLDPWPRT